MTMAGASAAGHDLIARAVLSGRISEDKEILVSKLSAVVISLLAIGLGILFENQNIAFMVGLVFAIAASANFPVIFLSVVWKNLTTCGAVAGSVVGLVCALAMAALAPGVWTTVLKLAPSPFPHDNPALFSVPLAFAVMVIVPLADHSKGASEARAPFGEQYVTAHTGLRPSS